GAYTRAAEAIREKFGCVVIIVHHCGWDATRLRGHSSLPGAVDAELSVVREGDVATVTVKYMREGPEETQVVVRSRIVEVGEDAGGRPLTSLVMLRYDGDVSSDKENKPLWPRTLKVFRKALIDALVEHGFEFQIESGPKVRAVDLDRVRDTFFETYVVATDAGVTKEQKRDSKRKALWRAVERAQALNLIAARSLPDGRQFVWM